LPGTTGVAAPILPRGMNAEAALSAVWIEARDEAATAELVVRSAASIAAALR
jgi:hypothetical protein